MNCFACCLQIAGTVTTHLTSATPTRLPKASHSSRRAWSRKNLCINIVFRYLYLVGRMILLPECVWEDLQCRQGFAIGCPHLSPVTDFLLIWSNLFTILSCQRYTLVYKYLVQISIYKYRACHNGWHNITVPGFISLILESSRILPDITVGSDFTCLNRNDYILGMVMSSVPN